MKQTRVALADDHPIILTGIGALLATAPDIEITSSSISSLAALAAIKRDPPDVAVIDLSMPDLDGLELTAQLKAAVPSVKLLVLTVHEDRGYVHQALRSGVDGYLLKRSAADDLIRAIRAVASGEMYLDPAIAAKAITPAAEPTRQTACLSERESDVVRLVALGFMTKEIAEQLSISVKTVETYKGRAVEKLDLRTRVQIVRFAAAQGWLEDC